MDALEKALLDFSMTRAEKPTKQQRNAAQEAAHRPYEAMSEVTRAATPYVSLGQKRPELAKASAGPAQPAAFLSPFAF